MGRKEKIPPPGNKKDQYTNFWNKGKWKAAFAKVQLDCIGRNMCGPGATVVANALQKNKMVTHLDFAHNHFGDEGAIDIAQMLKVNEYIQIVNLACNEITDIGGIALASAFIPTASPNNTPAQWNRTVCHLILTGNSLGDDSLAALAVAAAVHRDLSRVELQYNEIGPMGARSLMKSIQRNTTCMFLLGHNRLGDQGTVELCAAWKTFGIKGTHSYLNLWHNDICRIGADAIGQLLSDNDFVGEVNLSWNTIGAKGCEGICRRIIPPFKTVLRVLNLANNCIGDEGAEEVAKGIEGNIETLIKINLSNNEIGERGGIALGHALGKNTFLLELLLAQNNINKPTAIEAFVESIKASKTLKKIVLKGNDIDEQLKTKLSQASAECQSSGFNLDSGLMDNVVPQEDFFEKAQDAMNKR